MLTDGGEADAYSFTDDDDARGDASRRSGTGKGDTNYSRKLHSLSLNLQTKRSLAERSSETRPGRPARQRFQLAPASFNSPTSASASTSFSASRKRRALFDDDDEDDTDWRVPSGNGASHSHSYRGSAGSRNVSLLRGGGMPRRFRKGAFLVNELDVDRERKCC